jgi:hypothetical protein
MSDEPRAVEQALMALKPLPAAFDRDRLMFQAGQRAASRRAWPWQAATAALAMVAAATGSALLVRPGPVTVERERIVYIEVPRPSSAPREVVQGPPEPGPSPLPTPRLPEYLRLQEQLLSQGLDGLPASATSSTAVAPSREQLLDMPRRPFSWQSILGL